MNISRIAMALCCLLLAGVLLESCAARETMNISDFRFRCRFAEDDELSNNDNFAGCDLQMQAQLCDQYTEVLKVEYANRDACIQGCNSVQAGSMTQTMFSSCNNFAVRTNTICEQYCRQHYPR
ncbi:hypothetical protein [Oceanidesulfovibrio marinus]|uniref:Cysteine rich repeat-containing protein n=1 Tax=Oceanidesulfovibrio marinus TaxID=370038 RepID=A0A6P1ZHM9_9BACT|nr:hypothetical protein [Oceanidesulfovibrio marinus]QJT10692.1 hypothetical protein E8L03_18000 [Oceanidesulfovibrio marinus]TVM34081.1 hypothetical protein DQK91_09255 [Oceanidesulfovibrio marinus]